MFLACVISCNINVYICFCHIKYALYHIDLTMYVIFLQDMSFFKSTVILKNVFNQLYKNKLCKKNHFLTKKWFFTLAVYKQCIRLCSTHIISSPHKNIDIPEITLPEYLSSRLETYADLPALVSILHYHKPNIIFKNIIHFKVKGCPGDVMCK